MSDQAIKQAVAEIPVPTFDMQSFVTPKLLHECTVAIVTTAGLRHSDQDAWVPKDTSFRVLDGARSDVMMGHYSPNFDRSGFADDINVVYPIDRVNELAIRGVIGRVAPRHISFVGNQDETMTALRLDSGPRAGEILRNDGVDVIVLTPV
jgi:D-proline reductase (dithiol) PrdB